MLEGGRAWSLDLSGVRDSLQKKNLFFFKKIFSLIFNIDSKTQGMHAIGYST
jgi:hypothetical protein